jgi:dienelactone hydrolase
MNVKVLEEFNVFELFVHDNEAIHAICPYELAEAITEHLIDAGYKVVPPESLDRFTLFNANDEEESYIERYYSIQQVKDELPDDVVQLLEDINGLELDLSPKQSLED